MMMGQDDDGAGRMMGQDDFNDGAGRSVNHIFSIHIMQCKMQFTTKKMSIFLSYAGLGSLYGMYRYQI